MKTILYVDDDPAVLTSTRRMLHGHTQEWRALFALGAHEAIHYLKAEHVDAVVTDVAMPGMTGLDLLKHISEGHYGFIPVVVVTGYQEQDLKRQALDLGAQDLLCKPVDFEDLVARLRSVLSLKVYHDELACRNAQLEDMVAVRTAELASSRLELVVQLSKAAELRDQETGGHIVRVGMFSRSIALAMGMTLDQANELFLASTLHDVGKIAIPDAILRKKDALSSEERRIMESHCMLGYRILSDRDGNLSGLLPLGMRIGSEAPRLLELAAGIARSHHERWDGTGYPDKLVGEEIPLPSRVVSVSDVLDALCSERPYKAALDWDDALQIIMDARGTQFDPAVLDAFLSVEAELKELDGVMRRRETHFLLEAA